MPVEVDPFGYMAGRPSSVRGIGPAASEGVAAPADRYVFHTPYLFVPPGRRELRVRFDGLRATDGALVLELMSLAEEGAPAALVSNTLAPLASLEGGRGRAVRFVAEPGAAYALYAHTTGGNGAEAAALHVTVDAVETGETSLRRARRAVFGRASRVGRRVRFGASPLVRAGLIVRAEATLRRPLSQMCTAAQFEEPEFGHWIDALGLQSARHRKLWEFAYVLQVLETRGVLRPGARGLGFGVGSERLPSLLAARGIDVCATDLPGGDAQARVWAGSGQHSDDLSRLHVPEICPRDAFDRRVRFRAVDMNAIPDDLQGFDFCWSACAYEHLGSIEAGLRFFRESMRCLRPGGVAVHTTELNLVSDDRTLERGMTVLFRRSDMERLALELHEAGHEVSPITYDLGDRPLDRHVDLPPYANDPHLKLLLQSYVSTSFGLVARRGGG